MSSWSAELAPARRIWPLPSPEAASELDRAVASSPPSISSISSRPKELDRAGFAREFLRRNPEYREDYRRALERVAMAPSPRKPPWRQFPVAGGCPFVRDPDGPANLHPTIWRPELLPPTVVLVTAPDCYPKARELAGRSRMADERHLRRRRSYRHRGRVGRPPPVASRRSNRSKARSLARSSRSARSTSVR